MGGAGELDTFDAGRCADGYALGLAVGRRFAEVIQSRMRQDLVLREQLLPFASTAQAQALLAALQSANRQRYPRYWDELVGTADGSGVPLLHVRTYSDARCFHPRPASFLSLTPWSASCFRAGHPGQLQEGGPAVHP